MIMFNKENNNKDRRAFDAILFDLGGTLIYFDGEWKDVISRGTAALLSYLKKSGLELDRDSFSSSFWVRLQEYYVERETEFIEYTTAYLLRNLLEEYGHRDVSEEILRDGLEQLYRVSQQHWKVEADTGSTLETLRNQGYRLGLISNAGDDDDVQALIDNAGIRHFFDIIVTSAALGIRKPNPAIFHKVLQELEVEPSRSVMIGDTLGADIFGAQNAGVFSILLTRRADTAANRAHLDTIQPDAEISTLAELPGVIESWPS